MTPNPFFRFRRWIGVLALAGTLLFPEAGIPGLAQAEPDTPPPAPVEPTPTPRKSPKASAREAEATPDAGGRSARRQKVSQLVEIGGPAQVQTNQVADGVVVVRGNARIDGDVDGDVVVVLGNVDVRGRIHGDLVVVMGEADIQGTVDGDVALVLTRSRIGATASLRGDVVAAGVAPDLHPDATLRREPEIISFGPLMRYFDWARDYLFQGVFLLRPFPPGLAWVWVVAAICLALNLLLALLFPGAIRGCVDTLREKPARSFLVGLLTCVLVGPVSILLSFAVVATPLIWLAYFALCVVGRVSVYAVAGAEILREPNGSGLRPFRAVLVGSLLFYVAYMVPVLGFLVYWIVLPWGVGAALMRLLEALRRERQSVSPGYGPGAGMGPQGAASALAGGWSGPATHASVETPTESGTPGPTSTSTPTPTPPPMGASPGAVPGPETSAPPPPPPPPPPRASAPFPSPLDTLLMPRVGFGPRFAASLLDFLVIGFTNAMTFQTGRAFWFLFAIYHAGMWVWKGTTLGGSVLGIRLVRLDGRPLDWQTAIYRVLGAVLSLLPLGLGFIWVCWDAEAQSWHDRIAGTTVVKPDRHAPLV